MLKQREEGSPPAAHAPSVAASTVRPPPERFHTNPSAEAFRLPWACNGACCEGGHQLGESWAGQAVGQEGGCRSVQARGERRQRPGSARCLPRRCGCPGRCCRSSARRSPSYGAPLCACLNGTPPIGAQRRGSPGGVTRRLPKIGEHAATARHGNLERAGRMRRARPACCRMAATSLATILSFNPLFAI